MRGLEQYWGEMPRRTPHYSVLFRNHETVEQLKLELMFRDFEF
jgi:hypothetical protein